MVNAVKDLEGAARTRARNKIWNSDRYRTRYVILFQDMDVQLPFVLCRARKIKGGNKILLESFRDEAQGRKALADPRFIEHWVGYEPKLVRYEALRDFPDQHRRGHWRFESQLVTFFGSPAQMDWVSKLTSGGAATMLDGEKGLWLPGQKLASAARPN